MKTKGVHFFPYTKDDFFLCLPRWVSVICKNFSGIQKSHRCMWKTTHRNYSMATNKKAQNIIIQTRVSNSYKYSQIELKVLWIPIENNTPPVYTAKTSTEILSDLSLGRKEPPLLPKESFIPREFWIHYIAMLEMVFITLLFNVFKT